MVYKNTKGSNYRGFEVKILKILKLIVKGVEAKPRILVKEDI